MLAFMAQQRRCCHRLQSLAHVLAAMAPCARLYAYLGCQLAAARPGVSHKYARWAVTYSGAQYRGWVARKERLLDRCGRGVPYGEPESNSVLGS